MHGTFDSYTILESELFVAQRDAISPDVRRIDDLLEGIMWGLGLNPQQFGHVVGSLWRARTDAYPGAPSLRVWFKINDAERRVDLLAIEQVDGDF